MPRYEYLFPKCDISEVSQNDAYSSGLALLLQKLEADSTYFEAEIFFSQKLHINHKHSGLSFKQLADTGRAFEVMS